MEISLRFDIIVELVSFVTALALVGFSLFTYHRTHAQRHLVFAGAFLLLAFAAASNTVFNYLVEMSLMKIPLRGYLAIHPSVDLFRFLFHILSIGGYVLIFLIAERVESVRVALLTMLLAPLTAWVAHEIAIVYHLVAVIILSFAVYHFYRGFLETRSTNGRNVALGFSALILSEIIFAFTIFNIAFYHAGHALRLLAFAILLFTLGCIYQCRSVTVQAPVTNKKK